MAAAAIISLFLLAALNSLRRVLVEINNHQVLFRIMWDEDRAREEHLRQEDLRLAAEEECIRQAALAAAQANAPRRGNRRSGRNSGGGGGGGGGGDGGGGGADTGGGRSSRSSNNSGGGGGGYGGGDGDDDGGMGAGADIGARMEQMERELNELQRQGPADPAERKRWLIQRGVEIRAQYPDVLQLAAAAAANDD